MKKKIVVLNVFYPYDYSDTPIDKRGVTYRKQNIQLIFRDYEVDFVDYFGDEFFINHRTEKEYPKADVVIFSPKYLREYIGKDKKTILELRSILENNFLNSGIIASTSLVTDMEAYNIGIYSEKDVPIPERNNELIWMPKMLTHREEGYGVLKPIKTILLEEWKNE